MAPPTRSTSSSSPPVSNPTIPLFPMEIRGRAGHVASRISGARMGARAYLGALLPGFPELLHDLWAEHHPTEGLQVVDMEEVVTRFALACIGHLITENKRSIDVTEDAYLALQRRTGSRSRSRRSGGYNVPQQLLHGRVRTILGKYALRRSGNTWSGSGRPVDTLDLKEMVHTAIHPALFRRRPRRVLRWVQAERLAGLRLAGGEEGVHGRCPGESPPRSSGPGRP